MPRAGWAIQMMRNDRFTEQAQEVLASSQALVRESRHAQWDVEHVFYALIRLKDGLARDVLSKMGVDPEAVGRAVKARAGQERHGCA
jgi:ATP-dependent Clp protease ATP-binding subunit ClpC